MKPLNLPPRCKLVRWALAAGILLAALLLSACTDFTVKNTTAHKAYVIVQLPGTSGNRVNLVNGNSTYAMMSLYGGDFVIKVLPDQEYLQILENAKAGVKQMMDAAHGNPDAPAGEWKTYWDQYLQLAARIQEIQMTGARCSGNVEFFGTVTATLSKKGQGGYADDWNLACYVENPVVDSGGD